MAGCLRRAVVRLGIVAALLLDPALGAGSAHAGTADGIGGRPWPAPFSRKDAQPLPASASIIEATAHGDKGRSAGAMRPPVDGELTWPSASEARMDADSEIDALDAAPEPLSIDRDVRAAQDVDAFARPPAGFDPDAFAIELDPLQDRRPGRLFQADPFEPLGVRIGTFVLYPQVELGAAAFSNVFLQSRRPRRDHAFEVRPMLRAVSIWPVHAIEVRAEGGRSYHDAFASEDDRAALLEARGRLDVTRRTSVEALASWELTQEARDSINTPAAASERADVQVRRAGVNLNHRFNRLALQLRGTFADFGYGPVAVASGAPIDNDDRDYVETGAALRASWLLKHGLSAFAETALHTRDYAGAPGDGILRNSRGERHRLGVSFGTGGGVARGEVSLGYGRQDFDSPLLPKIDGILVDANAAWRISGLTTLLLSARSELRDSTLSGSGGALSRSVGVEVRHAFLRRLVGSAGVRVTREDYAGISLSERQIGTLLGLEYHLGREVVLFSRYQHTEVDSTDRARNYNADEVRVGMRLRR